MAGDLKELRALIKDHQEKDSGLSIDCELILQTWLIQELSDLETEKIDLQREFDGSMADADTSAIDARIDAKRDEIDKATVLIHFKALTEPKYRDVIREYPVLEDSSPAEEAAFLAALASVCYRGVNWGGREFSAVELPWSELCESASFGEMEPIYAVVHGLNRRKIDRPLSSRPSKRSPRI